MGGDILIYGATGYTGKLMAAEAARRGLRPILAGRNPAKLKSVAAPLGLDWRAADLDDPSALDRLLTGVGVVLHIAGPFSATSRPMVDACLRNRAHYLDITGEIGVLQVLATRDAEAKAAGIMVLPGVGFDVVPSDCLAAHTAARVDRCRTLTIGIGGLSKMSRGTAKSSIESVATPTRIRRDGVVSVAWPPLRRQFDFGQGQRPAIAVGWGDVFTAHLSTGAPDITVYFEAMPQLEQMAKLGGFARWMLSTGPMQALVKSLINRLPEGPTEHERATGKAVLICEATGADGTMAVSRLTTVEAYALTAVTGTEIAARVRDGDFKAGFQTPALAYGADFITRFAGCRIEDL